MTSNSKLGPYEIISSLGKGGMGEVWRARDPRLNREVAIKISALQFTDRFEREAHAIASLNHPNVCTLFDIGPNYLVMELIEGPTLGERIAEGPIPVEEALAIAKQIADALEAAHEKGIVHRDLKPGNVKIRPDGSVKVLDFGLAKAGVVEGAVSGDSPTMMAMPTQAGMILGTAAYMAPEQARGKTVDKRADIWSFGVVLHEMLTGKRAFEGEDLAETLASVVKSDPDLTPVPPKVRRLLAKCLQKDPRKRLRDIGDWADYIESAPQALEQLPVPARDSRSRVAWIAAAVLLALAIVALAGWWHAARPAELRPLVRLDLELEPPVSPIVGSGPILSPDGSRISYVAQRGGLYTRLLDQAGATEIKGTDGATAPFFSPDGQWVGFYAAGGMKKASVAGGEVVAISGAGASFNRAQGAWGEGGAIVSTVGIGSLPLVRVPAAGGRAETLGKVSAELNERVEGWPQILPGARFVLYTGRTMAGQPDDGFAMLLSLSDMSRKVVRRNAAMARYAELPNGSGYLLYVNHGTLFATPFDPKRPEAAGPATPLLGDVVEASTLSGAQFDVSANGTLVYQRGKNAGTAAYTLQWIDSAGKLQPLLAKPGPFGRPRISPDGNRLAFDNAGDIWTYDWKRDIMTRLTFDGGNGAVWSRDGRFILYDGANGIEWTRSDGGTAPKTLIAGQNLLYPWSFSPDGKRLAYFEITGNGYDIYTATIENDGATLKAGQPEPYLKTPADERYGSFSPDGRWMLYASDESGSFQVYVRAFPDTGGKWQISNAGGTYPEWSADGRAILFRTPEYQIMTANYTAKGDVFTPEKPRLFAEEHLAEVGVALNWDLHPDGKRIVAVLPAESSGGPGNDGTHVTILLNFFDELRRKVSAGK